jgi:hypothetical protein
VTDYQSRLDALRKLQSMTKVAETAKAAERVPVIQERVHVTPVTGAAYLLKDDSQWTWEDLRDYVMGQIEAFHGPQLRNPTKEASIFKGFLKRHGGNAVAIARFAFEMQRGMWQRAPISVNRFCAGSDPYFANIISERL